MKKFVKIMTLVMVMLCMFACGSLAYGADVQIDGKTMELRYEPINVDGRVYLPLRNVFELLGARVVWDGETNEIVATKDMIKVEFSIGDDSAYVTDNIYGRFVSFYGTPFVQEGTTYVPVRFAADALGLNIGWDNDNQTVIIIDNDKLLAQYLYTTEKFDLLLAFFGRYNEKGGYQANGKANMTMIKEHNGLDIPINASAKYIALMDVRKNVRFDLDCEVDFTEAIKTAKVSVEELQALGLNQNTELKIEYVKDAVNEVDYFRGQELNKLVFDLYPSTWIKRDFKALAMDVDTKVTEDKKNTVDSQISIKDIVEERVRNYPLTSIDDYASLHNSLAVAQSLLDDDNFKYNSEEGYYENKQVFDNGAMVVDTKIQIENDKTVKMGEISFAFKNDEGDVQVLYMNDIDNNVTQEMYIHTEELLVSAKSEAVYTKKENYMVSLSAVNEGNMINYQDFLNHMDLQKSE